MILASDTWNKRIRTQPRRRIIGAAVGGPVASEDLDVRLEFNSRLRAPTTTSWRCRPRFIGVGVILLA